MWGGRVRTKLVAVSGCLKRERSGEMNKMPGCRITGVGVGWEAVRRRHLHP